MVLAIAAEMDWEVRQVDVKTAFLYADIEEVFVAEPPGFETNDNEKVLLVMKPVSYTHLTLPTILLV